jgi:hypothetical protein
VHIKVAVEEKAGKKKLFWDGECVYVGCPLFMDDAWGGMWCAIHTMGARGGLYRFHWMVGWAQRSGVWLRVLRGSWVRCAFFFMCGCRLGPKSRPHRGRACGDGYKEKGGDKKSRTALVSGRSILSLFLHFQIFFSLVLLFFFSC